MEKEFIHYYLDAFEQLPRRAKELLFEEDGVNENTLVNISNNLEYIQSPIEQILFTAMCIFSGKHKPYIYIEPQREINIGNHKYIVDFIIEYDNYFNNFLKEDFKLVIECDGFDYHSNKKQMTYDYERENVLKLNGYDVIRFTGSQIYNNPMECLYKIIEYIKLEGVDNKNE